MGTRSTTKIYQDGQFLVGIFKRYDGYVEGWGNELKKFIKSGVFGNGIPGNYDKTKHFFNGAGCFAAQLIKEYKERPGELYVTTEDDLQEYNYKIDLITDPLLIIEKVRVECEQDESYNETIEVYKKC